MKITRLQLYQVPPRWLFLRIDTDCGISGWGEPIVEGRADTVAAAVDEFADYLIGQDPRRIEHHWQVMYRGFFYRGGPVLMSAISGIEQALWDIKGKALGVPVYELLGGAVRDKVRVYSWIGGDDPKAVVEEAQSRMAAGFTAVKMNGCGRLRLVDSPQAVDEVVERVALMREVVGKSVDIAIDFHGRVSKAMAKILVKGLEPFRPMFIEEPVLPEHLDSLKEIAAATTIPLATGERLYTRWDFKRLLEEGHIAIVQPDVSHTGGIWEMRKIAAMAETYDVALAPHCPLGPIALAASLQVDACTRNAIIQEQSLGLHYNKAELLEYLRDPGVFSYQDGHVTLPQGPGLGIEIDEEKVAAAAKVGHRWRNPIWYYEDGTVAEW